MRELPWEHGSGGTQFLDGDGNAGEGFTVLVEGFSVFVFLLKGQ